MGSSSSPEPMKVEKPRRPKTSVPASKFSFINSYSVVEKDTNPLITGSLKNVEASASLSSERNQQTLHLDLYDLVQVKKAFEDSNKDEDAPLSELTLEQFVTAFSGLVGSSMKQQLGYLFMKIDCDCDGHVTWDELLTFVLSQNRNGSNSDLLESQYVRVEVPDCSGSEAHRDTASQTIYVPKVGTYLSAGRDGTLRVWSATLRHELTLPVSEERTHARLAT